MTASAEGRWALVLGIGAYDSGAIPALENAVNDSRTMAASLNTMGFDVYYLENAGKTQIEETVALIGREQQGAELGLFYFAGHGVQINGENFALPSDIVPSGKDFLQRGAVSVSRLIKSMNGFGTQSLVVILDACRNAPFPGEDAIGVGLALFDAPDNTIVAYATAPGAVALDGALGNSPYTAALASALEGAERDIRDVLRLVRARVRLATGGAQTPWYIDNSKAPIVIQPRFAQNAAALVQLVSERDISLSTTAWLTIVESADPRDFEQFVVSFPRDTLVDAAQRQLEIVGGEDAPDFPLLELRVQDAQAEVPGGLLSRITACDILATDFANPMALVEPVPHDLVNTRAALRACVEAVRDDPENPRLLGLLGRVLQLDQRYTEALHYFEMAAARGNPTAFTAVATIYRLGMGVVPDTSKAFEAVREGALLGSAPARLLMGVYYREGWGTQQSFPEARRWMRLSLNAGYAPAYVAYGGTYRKGLGVTASDEKALEYYRIAALLGSSDAVNLIGRAYMGGKGVDRDVVTGINWLVRSSDAGNPYAALELGRAFLSGNGVEQDREKALSYFRLSAQRNFLGAYNSIGDILRSGTQTRASDLPQAYANYVIARDAALLLDTRDSEKQLTDAQDRIAAILPTMTPPQVAAGQQLAADWIDQYGLLDFSLVSE